MPSASPQQAARTGPRYKWIALSNTTLGMLMATVNSSIMLIALPDIFRGIGVNPLQPGNTTLLLWLLMGYLVVTAVLVVSFGRLGDMFGRVRMFNLGFAIFALDIAFDFAIVACLVAAVASLLRGRRYVHEEHGGQHEPAVSGAALSGAAPSGAALSGDDDLEGGQAGVLRVGDAAPVGRHLAQRR